MNLSTDYISRLMVWFFEHGRRLPWRGETDPYKIWISETMLQQTQVSTVIDYYLKWMERFPTIESLAESELEAVLRVWEGLGYYARARNLHKGAAYIIKTKSGRFPENYKELLEIPGVGPYTAGAIASLAFNQPKAAIDGNVFRVLSRILTFPYIKSNKSITTLSKILEGHFGDFEPRWVNQAWMELGALVCQSRPLCSSCCLKTLCRAFTSGQIDRFPVRSPSKAVPLKKGAVFIIRQNNHVLMLKRPESGLLGCLWEPPNVLYDMEEQAHFLKRTNIRIQHQYSQTATHAYSHFKVEYTVFEATLQQPWKLSCWTKRRWCSPDEILALPKPKVHIKSLRIANVIFS